MARNVTATSGTKHVDIRYRYVNSNECIDDGIVKIVFVKSAEHDSNILAKNLSRDLHYRQSKKFYHQIFS